MTKKELRYLLRRFPYITDAIKHGHVAAFITISGRKERIAITDDIKKFHNIILKAIAKTQDETSKQIFRECCVAGNTDVNAHTKISITRGTFNRLKNQLVDRLFCLCTLNGLVTEDEILED